MPEVARPERIRAFLSSPLRREGGAPQRRVCASSTRHVRRAGVMSVIPVNKKLLDRSGSRLDGAVCDIAWTSSNASARSSSYAAIAASIGSGIVEQKMLSGSYCRLALMSRVALRS